MNKSKLSQTVAKKQEAEEGEVVFDGGAVLILYFASLFLDEMAMHYEQHPEENKYLLPDTALNEEMWGNARTHEQWPVSQATQEVEKEGGQIVMRRSTLCKYFAFEVRSQIGFFLGSN